MGYTAAHCIEAGALLLLSILEEKRQVDYSTFYDGTDETADDLRKRLGLEDDWYSAENVIDLAATQLSEQGLVALRDLETKLADEEPDYTITLTARGRAWLTDRFPLAFRDME